MNSLKHFIFNQLPSYFKVNDSYKVDGEGLLERLTNSLGEEVDSIMIDGIGDFSAIVNPEETPEEFLPYLAYLMGNPPQFLQGTTYLRLWLTKAWEFYQLKGTLAGYKLLFRVFGMDVEIIEHSLVDGRYDDSGLYDTEDDGDGLYDTDSCSNCAEYTLLYKTTSRRLGEEYPYNIDILVALSAVVGVFNLEVNYHTYSILNASIITTPTLRYYSLTNTKEYRISVEFESVENYSSLSIGVDGVTSEVFSPSGGLTAKRYSTRLVATSPGALDIILTPSTAQNYAKFRVIIEEVKVTGYVTPPDSSVLTLVEDALCYFEPVNAKLRAMQEYVALGDVSPVVSLQNIQVDIKDGPTVISTTNYTIP